MTVKERAAADAGDRLAAQIYTITDHLGPGWTASEQEGSWGSSVAYELAHTDGRRFRLSVTHWDAVRVTACGLLPHLPHGIGSSEVYTADIHTGHINMAPAKLENPRALAKEINRRLVPDLGAAALAQQHVVARFRARERLRRRAAALIALVPGLSGPTRNELHITRTDRRFHLSWNGKRHAPPYGKNAGLSAPSVRASVEAGESAAYVTIEMNHLSSQAARAAITAAIETTEREHAAGLPDFGDPYGRDLCGVCGASVPLTSAGVASIHDTTPTSRRQCHGSNQLPLPPR